MYQLPGGLKCSSHVISCTILRCPSDSANIWAIPYEFELAPAEVCVYRTKANCSEEREVLGKKSTDSKTAPSKPPSSLLSYFPSFSGTNRSSRKLIARFLKST